MTNKPTYNMTEHQKQLIKAVLRTVMLNEGRSWSFSNHSKVEDPALKLVAINSTQHLKMLRKTLKHLEALKRIYPKDSATRHVLTQACVRIKRLINKLENNR